MTALLLAAVLAASATSACSKDKDEAPDDDVDARGSDVTSTTTGRGGPGTTAAAGTPTTARKSSPPPSATAPKSRSGTATTQPGRTVNNTGSRGSAGAYARYLLRAEPVDSIVIEVLHHSGAAPQSRSVDHVVSSLQSASGKPVSKGGPVVIPGEGRAYSVDQLRDLADAHMKTREPDTRGVLHFMYLHGTFNGDDGVLGLAIRGDTVVIFVDQVASAASPVASRSTIEDAVSQHELGHVLGLVDLVLSTGRGDKEHPGHSTNEQSVMYWAVESDLISQALGGPPPVDFDDADRADLRTIRNGG